jgi:hypothetical protein
MGKKLRVIPKFVSWEQEDEFWSTHDLTDLDLQEDSTPLVMERGALGRRVKKIEVANPTSMRPWKRKTA